MNMSSKKVARARQAAFDNQQAWNSTMGKTEKRITLYTLAPSSLDKPGTESVGAYWLYSSEQVPEQALREVIMPESSHVAQHQAYTLQTPYITFTEVGLGKALARGEVYRADEQTRDENPIVTGIDATIAQIENAIITTAKEMDDMPKGLVHFNYGAIGANATCGIALKGSASCSAVLSEVTCKACLRLAENMRQKEADDMPRTKIDTLPARTAKNDALRTKDKAPVTPQVPAMDDMTPLGILPDAKIRTLDAILAAPIVGAYTITQEVVDMAAMVAQGQVAMVAAMDKPVRGAQLAAEAVAAMRQADAEADAIADAVKAETERLQEEIEEAMRLKEGRAQTNPSNDPPATIRIREEDTAIKPHGLQTTMEKTIEDIYSMLATMQEAQQHILALFAAQPSPYGAESIPMPEPMPEPVKDPDIWDILGDGTGAPMPVATTPKSTRRILTQSAAPKEGRAQGGKTDPAIVKAIQTAWKSGKVTQAALAAQYGMTDKRIWAILHRAKQLV